MEDFDIFRLDGHCLRIFVSVFETNSVSRTAELFGLNQSTISHQIEKMRAAVGDPLFVRSGRGVTPTEKAIALLPRVQWILSEIEGLLEPEQYLAAVDSRPFVIAIPTPAVLEDIGALYARLQTEAPDMQLVVRRLAPRSRITEMLHEDEADLAIAVRGLRYPVTLKSCPYGQDDLAVFYDPDKRAAPDTLSDYAAAKHAVVSFGGGVKSVVDQAMEAQGVARKISIVAPTASTLGELVKGTTTIATMPRRLDGLASFANLAQCAPPFTAPQVEYDLVWHRRYENSARNIWLRRQVLQVAAAIYAQAPGTP